MRVLLVEDDGLLGDGLAAIVAGGEARHVAHELEEHADDYELPVIYQVWRVGGKDVKKKERAGKGGAEKLRPALLLRSPGAPETSLAGAPGFSERDYLRATWRFFQRDHEGYRVSSARSTPSAIGWRRRWPSIWPGPSWWGCRTWAWGCGGASAARWRRSEGSPARSPGWSRNACAGWAPTPPCRRRSRLSWRPSTASPTGWPRPWRKSAASPPTLPTNCEPRWRR